MAEIENKRKFDSIAIRKIGKGALISGFYGLTVFILSSFNGVDFGDSTMNGIATVIIPTILNTLKEWYISANRE
jgi:hypothetical protein